MYCWSDRPILCGDVIEFDGKKCLYSRSFRFYTHFDVSEKKHGMPCSPKKKRKKKKKKKMKKKKKKKKIYIYIYIYIFATFPLLANANKIY